MMKNLLSTLSRGVLLVLFVSLLTVGLVTRPALATSLYEMPTLGPGNPTWVVDKAEIFSRLNEGKLTGELKDLAQDTSNEVRIVTVRGLDYGETIESFTEKLFEKWYPSPEARQNQTLLAINVVTNNIALKTGEGSAELLSDEIAESIVDKTLGIPIRQGNQYNKAFLNASDRLSYVLAGQPDPGPPNVEENDIQVESTFTRAEDTDDESATTWVIALLVAATIIPMATYFVYLAFDNQS